VRLVHRWWALSRHCRTRSAYSRIARRWRKPDANGDWLPDLLSDAATGSDRDGNPVVLFTDDWAMKQFAQRNPGVELSDIPWKS
jgi:peptide subunit release factor RF-3